MKRLVTILALGVLVSACSSTPPGPPPPPPFSPVGEYSVTIDVGGQALAGTVTIQDTDAGLTGSLLTDMGAAEFSSLVVEGRQVTFSIEVPVQASFIVMFEGEDFTGEFDAGPMGTGTITGVKR